MNPAGLAMWAVPAAVGGTWFIWPALDQEWLIELGLAKEPDLHIKAVQAAKEARMAAKKKAKPASEEEEEEEEEAEEEPAAEEESDEGGDEEAGGEEEEGGDEGGDDDDEEEEDESSIPKFEPLLPKTAGKTQEEIWDNFTLKSIRPGEDDDEEEDDDDDDDDE